MESTKNPEPKFLRPQGKPWLAPRRRGRCPPPKGAAAAADSAFAPSPLACWLKVFASALRCVAPALAPHRVAITDLPDRGAAMPPKFYQSEVLRKLRSDVPEEGIRKDLEDRQCPAKRILQMFKGAREIMKAHDDVAHVEAEHVPPAVRKQPAPPPFVCDAAARGLPEP